MFQIVSQIFQARFVFSMKKVFRDFRYETEKGHIEFCAERSRNSLVYFVILNTSMD